MEITIIKSMFMVINQIIQMCQQQIVVKLGQVDVQIFHYLKQKRKNLGVKQNYGKVKFVPQEKLIGIQYGVQVDHTNT